MPIDSVNEKLGQAKRALLETHAEERKTLSNYPDRFSAFLSAARSVDYRLRCEYGDKYRDWRKTWNANASPRARNGARKHDRPIFDSSQSE
jgi:hypothetical protein